jgi:hypothetical protein
LDSPLIEVTGVGFSTVDVGSKEETLKGEDCDVPEIAMLVVLGSLVVLVAAGMRENAGVAVSEAVVAVAVAGVPKALEVPVGGKPEKPKPEGWSVLAGIVAGAAEAGGGGALAVAGAGDPKPKPVLGLVLEATGRGLLRAGATLALGEKENPAVVEEPKAGSDEGNFSVFSGLAGDIGS